MMRKMDILVPLLLLLTPVQLRAKSFQHYTTPMPWKKAQAYCREKHTDLVTIRDATDNLNFFHGWIGLHRKDSSSEWRWSRGDKKADFTVWIRDDPDFGEDCAFKKRNRNNWLSRKCSTRHTFTCYDGDDDDDKLVLVKQNKTWEAALIHCRGLKAVNTKKSALAYRNNRYDLATLRTEDDHIFAQRDAQNAITDEVWTGLRFLTGQWVWVGGEAVQYKNIKSCPNVRRCGTVVKNETKKFQIRDCTHERNFLCYKKP